ncbi:hypothetical protein MTR67_014280 [Solanum verrucosum]|uniref:Uncharacterized protein n=1 Tax=Solanum verrucosum TaxID=315347 RepID=A0AAF0QGK2_SOLVR|nr:hypothetical protein MTR67_014280 [Solanum verrucosum]
MANSISNEIVQSQASQLIDCANLKQEDLRLAYPKRGPDKVKFVLRFGWLNLPASMYIKTKSNTEWCFREMSKPANFPVNEVKRIDALRKNFFSQEDGSLWKDVIKEKHGTKGKWTTKLYNRKVKELPGEISGPWSKCVLPSGGLTIPLSLHAYVLTATQMLGGHLLPMCISALAQS